MEKNTAKNKQASSVKEFAEEELKLRDKTLSRTAPDKDQDRKGFDAVLAPMRGGMTSTKDEGITRIAPPSGPDIDKEALEHREKALRNTPPDNDPKNKKIEQVTAPFRGGMR